MPWPWWTDLNTYTQRSKLQLSAWCLELYPSIIIGEFASDLKSPDLHLGSFSIEYTCSHSGTILPSSAKTPERH